VTRGWLGVQAQPVTTGIADSLGMKKAEGAMVDEPQNGSPAAKSGVQSGDVITALNGTPVKDSRDLSRKVAALAPGRSVELDILRNGKSKTLTITLGELPNRKQANAENRETRPDSGSPHIGLRLRLRMRWLVPAVRVLLSRPSIRMAPPRNTASNPAMSSLMLAAKRS